MASDWYQVLGERCHVMIRTRTTEITVETEETVVIRRPTTVRVWCVKCATAVLAARPEVAAAATSVSPREIYRRVESGAVHFQESADGSLLVCLDSITPQE